MLHMLPSCRCRLCHHGPDCPQTVGDLPQKLQAASEQGLAQDAAQIDMAQRRAVPACSAHCYTGSACRQAPTSCQISLCSLPCQPLLDHSLRAPSGGAPFRLPEGHGGTSFEHTDRWSAALQYPHGHCTAGASENNSALWSWPRYSQGPFWGQGISQHGTGPCPTAALSAACSLDCCVLPLPQA